MMRCISFYLFLALASSIACAGLSINDFSFENKEVNDALIEVYESNPKIWEPGQLMLIGLCYCAEHRLDDAQAIFEKLREHAPSDPRLLRDLGGIHHVKGNVDTAASLYQQAWSEGHDLDALRQLVFLRIQTKDSAALESLAEDMLEHQTEDVDIQKYLLVFCLALRDQEEGKRIYLRVFQNLRKDWIDEDEYLRQLLLAASQRYNTPTDLQLLQSAEKGDMKGGLEEPGDNP